MAQAIEDDSVLSATPPRSLRRLALRGSIWTILGFGGSQALRLASNLVLTRLLFPEAFGMMSLVAIFLQGLELFSDLGIGLSIIQNPRGDDPNFWNTAWTIQILRGGALAACAICLAWPAANFWFRKPELAAIMIASGLTPLIAGFNSTKLFTANRHLLVGQLMVLDFATQVIGLIATLALTFAYRSVWALVVGSILSTSVKMVLSHVALKGPKNSLCWDVSVVQEIIRFGRWIFLSTSMSFLANQGDRILLGRFLDERTLGLYGIAFMMSDMIVRMISTLGSRIVLPAIGRVHREDPQRVPGVYDRVRRHMDAISLPMVGGLIAGGPIVVRLLFDPRYQAAGPMLSVLAVRAAVACTLAPLGYSLTALGRPAMNTLAMACRLIWLVAGIPIAWHIYGIWGAIWVTSTSEFPGLIILSYAASKNGLLSPTRGLRSVTLLSAGILIFAAASWIFEAAFTRNNQGSEY